MCAEKEREIAFIKEQLRMSFNEREESLKKIDAIFERQFELLEHYSGMRYATPRVAGENEPEKEFHTMRRNNSVFSRIARAEAAERKPAVAAQRQREYDDRIQSLLNPETKIVDEAEADA